MVVRMKPSLNYDCQDEKFYYLGKILDFIDSKNAKDCLSRMGIRNRVMVTNCIKILFMSMYFDYTVSDVVNELNRSSKLRKFAHFPEEIPTAEFVYECLSRSSAEQYCGYVNAILKQFYRRNRRKTNTFLVDATPSACDFNKDKRYITKEHLEKLNLKWSFSSTKGAFIGFKVTVVINKDTLLPVSILIHSGAPHDSKVFYEVLNDLRRRRIIKRGDILLFDRGYFSYRNYAIGINIFNIVPVIFPRNNFSIAKLKSYLSFPLDVYGNQSKTAELMKYIRKLSHKLFTRLKNWDDLKPVRGMIEDFFKVAKDAFGLGEFHSYTVESMCRKIYLCLLLTALMVHQGFTTKTKLQRLAEGNVIQDTPVKKKKSKKKSKTDSKQKTKGKSSKTKSDDQAKLNIYFTKIQSSLNDFTNI